MGIDNPEYKGVWEHPLIPNPDYKYDDTVYHRCSPCTAIGFELWQVKSGALFDDIIVTDSLEEAKAAYDATKAEKEDEMRKAQEEAKAAKEAEEAAAKEAEEEEWEEEGEETED